MQIRPWELEDAEALLGLLRQLNEALGEEQELSLESIRAHFREMSRYPELYENYVAEEGKALLGFLSLLHYRSVFHRKGTTLVNELVVDRELRGRGLGGELLRLALARARERGMDEIEVGVMKDNEGALRFYKRHGIDEEYLLLGKEFAAE